MIIVDAALMVDALTDDGPAGDELAGRVWELRHNVTPCDAAYLALAEARGRANGDFAHRQRRHSLHDRGHERGLVVEFAALPRGQLVQRFDRDREPAAGAPLVPDPADHAVDQQDRVVPGLARRGERAGGSRPRVEPLPGLARDDVRVEVDSRRTPRCGSDGVPVSPGRVQAASPSSSTRSSSEASSPKRAAACRGGTPIHLAKCAGVAGP